MRSLTLLITSLCALVSINSSWGTAGQGPAHSYEQGESKKKLKPICLDSNLLPFAQEELNRKLMHAVINADVSKAHDYIDCEADIHTISVYGDNLLHVALTNRHVDNDMLSLLLSKNISVNAPNSVGNTALHIAADMHFFAMTYALLKAGAQVNIRNIMKETPLHLAAGTRDGSETVQLLLNAGALVDARNLLDETPLHYAAIAGNTAAAKLLFRAGADVDTVDYLGNTPLHNAVKNEHYEIVEILLCSGVHFDINNKAGCRPGEYFPCAGERTFPKHKKSSKQSSALMEISRP